MTTEFTDAAASDLYRLVYFSEATAPMSDDELDDLLERSRPNNGSLGITGLLLYERGHFLQVLEGPAQNVIRLYGRIRQDPRHTNVTTLEQGNASGRQFSQWSMAHFKLDDESQPGLGEGYLRLMTSYRNPDQLRQETEFLDQYLTSLREILPGAPS